MYSIGRQIYKHWFINKEVFNIISCFVMGYFGKQISVFVLLTKGQILTSWRDWSDAVSGMSFYHWEIFKLEKIGDELREQGQTVQRYLSPVHQYTFNHTGSHTYNYQPTEAGAYALILEATDNANNSIYVRRFVIYDPNSVIDVTSTHMKSLNANPNASYQWQTWTDGQATSVPFTWEGHFINSDHVNGGFLNRIQNYPPQLNDPNIPGQETVFKKTITESLTDPTSTRTPDALANVQGITR